MINVTSCPDSMDTIFAHLANGGDLITLAQLWNVRYSDLIGWLNEDEGRKKRLMEALTAQQEWAVARLLHEIKKISFIDIRKIFNDDHTIKPPKEWPDDVAAAVAGIEMLEEFEGTGDQRQQVGWTKKLKLIDKLKALELLGKDLGRFVNRTEVSGKVTLEDLVTGSLAEKKE